MKNSIPQSKFDKITAVITKAVKTKNTKALELIIFKCNLTHAEISRLGEILNVPVYKQTPEDKLKKYRTVLVKEAQYASSVYKFRDIQDFSGPKFIKNLLHKNVSDKLDFSYVADGVVEIKCNHENKPVLTEVRKALWALGFYTKTGYNHVIVSQ